MRQVSRSFSTLETASDDVDEAVGMVGQFRRWEEPSSAGERTRRVSSRWFGTSASDTEAKCFVQRSGHSTHQAAFSPASK